MQRTLIVAGVLSAAGFAACSAAEQRFEYRPDAGAKDAGEDVPIVAEDAGFGDGNAVDAPTCLQSAGNFDVPGDNCDNDGDGTIDNPAGCDEGLEFEGTAWDFAKAIGLCQVSDGEGDRRWGVISAEYTQGYAGTGQPADGQHGLLPKFGDVLVPREGAMLGVLSSGYAREWDDPVAVDCGTSCLFQGGEQMQTAENPPGAAPPGYPKAAAGCAISNVVNDAISLKLKIKVPDNAKGLQFDFNFFSGEWPQYVCTTFNDTFIAYYKSQAFNDGEPENISFDAQGNPVSVNNGFFDRCTPDTTTGCSGGPPKLALCEGGEEELAGTAYGVKTTTCSKVTTAGGATGWLTTQAPVQPGEIIELDFIIWDTGDHAWDSSVLIDNFQWVPTETSTGTTRPPS